MKCGMKLFIHFETSTFQPFMFRNGLVVSYHSLSYTWFLSSDVIIVDSWWRHVCCHRLWATISHWHGATCPRKHQVNLGRGRICHFLRTMMVWSARFRSGRGICRHQAMTPNTQDHVTWHFGNYVTLPSNGGTLDTFWVCMFTVSHM